SLFCAGRPQGWEIVAGEGLAVVSIGSQESQVGVRHLTGAKSCAVWHHVRDNRKARLAGAVGARAVEGERVMEARLAGLEDARLIQPGAAAPGGKLLRQRFQVLAAKRIAASTRPHLCEPTIVRM